MENQELIKKLESYTMNELNTYLLNHNDVEEDVFRHFADRVDWSSISCFKKLSENFIRDFADRVNWESISTNQELSEPFIREFADRVDWSHIPYYNQKLSENFIRDFADRVNWEKISTNQGLSEPFIREFADRVDWNRISCFQKLSENFIRDFADRVNWKSISTNQELSEPFIREFADRVDWSRIPYNKKLSENFIREFVDKKELIMAGQFTIKETGIGTLYSCEKYSCFIRGTILSEVTINEDIEELYVPEGVTIFAPGFLNKKDCKVSRIILPSSLKKLDCTSFDLYSLRGCHGTIDIDEIEIPSFSVVFDNTEELSWNQPFVVCKDSSFRLNISCLSALKSQFPNAFSENGQGKCFFDNMWNDEYLEYRSLDEDSVISIGYGGREELIVPEICKQREDPKEKKIIACCFNCAPKRIYFPKTVQYVAFCCEGKEKKLFELFDFAGKLPSFAEYNSGIDDAKLELLRINAPVAETDVPTLLKIMLEDAIDTGRIKYNGEVIFAAPALCDEDSSVPGFIRATARLRDYHRLKDQISGKDKDIVISLNTRYIGSVEPFDIEMYTPCVGSLVHIVTTGVEKHYTYVVYEPVETIMEKIRQTREHLDLESMIDRIREVLPKEIRE